MTNRVIGKLIETCCINKISANALAIKQIGTSKKTDVGHFTNRQNTDLQKNFKKFN
jgi:hypothetical protein